MMVSCIFAVDSTGKHGFVSQLWGGNNFPSFPLKPGLGVCKPTILIMLTRNDFENWCSWVVTIPGWELTMVNPSRLRI